MRSTPPPQRPPGSAPTSITLEEVYAARAWPDEDEALWGRDPPIDQPFRVLRFDPQDAIDAWRGWDGATLRSHARRIYDPRLVRAYAREAREGHWLGYVVIFRDPADGHVELLDGTHRIAAMRRAGVREAYAVDTGDPAPPSRRANPLPSAWGREALGATWDALQAHARPEWLPRSPNEPPIACGSDGCVWTTRGRHLVLKLTRDPSEAEFARRARSIGEGPQGIVRYHAAARAGNVWALWRTEARDVGKLRLAPRDVAGLIAFRDWAGDALLLDKRGGVGTEFWQEVERAQARVPHDAHLRHSSDRYGGDAARDRLALDVACCLRALDALSSSRELGDVVEALRFYLNRGILLADVHDGNLGRVQGRVVITEAGRWAALPRHPRAGLMRRSNPRKPGWYAQVDWRVLREMLDLAPNVHPVYWMTFEVGRDDATILGPFATRGDANAVRAQALAEHAARYPRDVKGIRAVRVGVEKAVPGWLPDQPREASLGDAHDYAAPGACRFQAPNYLSAACARKS